MMTALASLKCLLVLVTISLLWHALPHPLPAGLGWALLPLALLLAAVAFEREERRHPAEPEPQPRRARSTARPIRALIVGAGQIGRMIARRMAADANYEVVGFVDDNVQFADHGEWAVLGGRDATAQIVREYDIDEVILAYAPSWQQRLAEELTELQPDVQVRVVPSPYEALMHLESVQSLGDIAVVKLITDTRRRSERLKRLFYIMTAVGTLLVLGPVMLLVAVLIKLTSAGPIIFSQERIGRFGRPFTLYKFRTMVSDAESRTGPVLSSGREDSRLTSIGRWLRLFRFDELPQLWNVLRGEMSLVGPRPERPCFVEEFERTIPAYAKRHQVRPGITGLAQVLGGYHTDARDKLRFDLIYVSHQSLWMDLTILFRTVWVVVAPHKN